MPINKKLKAKLDALHAPYTVGTLIVLYNDIFKVVKIQPDAEIPERNVYIVECVLQWDGAAYVPVDSEDEPTMDWIHKIDEYPITTVDELIEEVKGYYQKSLDTLNTLKKGL